MERIEVTPYQPSWPAEYAVHVAQLLPAIQGQIARIDHIGSTSVPGLAAKDIIDIQIAVSEFTDLFVETMIGLGYRHHPHLTDNAPPNADPEQWRKQVFSEPVGCRRINIHVRRLDAPNMEQALLFRDYLRAHPATAAAHGMLKMRLAERHPEDREFYYAIKDSAFEIIWEAAQAWAANTCWRYDGCN